MKKGAPPVQHLVTHICDDVRFELGNKVSLIGIYDSTVVVTAAPARLSQLALFQRWSGGRNLRHVKVEVRGSASAGIHTYESRDLEPKKDYFQLALRFSPIDLVSQGELEFVTYLNREAKPAYSHKLTVRIDLKPDQHDE